MKISIYRRAHFNAAHRLHNPKRSDEKNREVFGICNNPYYHGHNYDLEVRLTGEVDEETGYLVDLKIMKDIIKQEIEDYFDHKNINEQLPEFQNMMASTENIAYVIYQRLRPHFSWAHKMGIRLYETANNFVEYNEE